MGLKPNSTEKDARGIELDVPESSLQEIVDLNPSHVLLIGAAVLSGVSSRIDL